MSDILLTIVASGGVFLAGYESWSRRSLGPAIFWWAGAVLIVLVVTIDFAVDRNWGVVATLLAAAIVEIGISVRLALTVGERGKGGPQN